MRYGTGPASRRFSPGGAAPVALIAALWLLLTACGGASDTAGDGSEGEVRGLVTEVQASSLVALDTLVLEDEAGVSWTFTARSYRGFTPSHLREHMVLGDPVTVTFRREGNAMVIKAISD